MNLAPTDQALEGVDLECVRGEQLLFAGLNFALAPGSILQIEGPNGAGKTSLLRIVCGLSLPESGEVRWQGHDIQHRRAEFFCDLAYLGHLHGLKAELTPLENLQVAASLCPRRSATSPREALERAGLTGYGDVLCRNLSAGQRRRAALARLLLTEARVWVLDEPVTAVDRRGIAAVENLVAAHVDGGGMVLLTSHQPLQFAGCETASIVLGPA